MVRVIVVDGEIGAGKTTILSALAEVLRARGLGVAVVPEPVDEWREVGILGRFYGDPARYAYEFQTYTFVTRIMAVRKCVRENPRADVFILERSILTDRHVFMELQRDLVGEQTMQMYDKWFGLHRELMPLDLSSATFLYLKPDIGECMKRVEARARREEVVAAADAKEPTAGGVSVEYQRRLRQAHEALFEGKVDTTVDCKVNTKAAKTESVRPFPLSAVVVVNGDLANANFKDGPRRAEIAGEVVTKLGFK